ncbi:MAG: dienelactone hydrolase family protein [Proteobacteria bacterium]|nr:dienelactone hydrolase family protein [Pseudomonadota bacterium]
MAAGLRLKWTGKPGAGPVVALAHGAGAPMDSPFLNEIADGIHRHGIAVVRFEFAYMRQRRQDGSRRPPDSAPKLLDEWRAVIAKIDGNGVAPERLVIGGKSMGGRIASMVADETGVAGLACLGYPFHPPGRAAAPARVAHLADLKTPALFVQGTRDAFGSRDDVAGYKLAHGIKLFWIEDGDHGLRPRKASGRTEAEALEEAAAAVAAFARRVGAA